MKAVIAAPVLGLLIYRAYSRNSLTTGGLVAATITGIAHAYHPWNLPFVLICVFFLAGTRVTHIKEGVKAKLTTSSSGNPGGEAARTHVQVFANSLMASILSIIHGYQLRNRAANPIDPLGAGTPSLCFNWGGDLLVVGIIANYAAVAADTFSSELGILARGPPRLITSPTFRKVPPGTNGGVTLTGLGAGLLGSMIIVTTAMFFTPFCGVNTAGSVGGGRPWTQTEYRTFMIGMTVWGALGSVLDSVLGGLLQRSVTDARTGRIIEGLGGSKVPVSSEPNKTLKRADVKATVVGGDAKEAVAKTDESAAVGTPSRLVESGWDILDNNDVNFLMAFTMSLGSMVVAALYWDTPLDTILLSS